MDELMFGLIRNSSRHRDPWQVAGAITLGCAIGLLPKLNLLFPAALILLACLPIHFPIAMLSLVACSGLAIMLHPLHGVFGAWLLDVDFLRAAIHRLERLPVFAWIGVHNTAVVGSAGFSAVWSLPAFLVLHRRFLQAHTRRASRESDSAVQNADQNIAPRTFVSHRLNPETTPSITRQSDLTTRRSDSPLVSQAVDSLFSSEFMVITEQNIQFIHPPASPLSVRKPDGQDGSTAPVQGSAGESSFRNLQVRQDEALKHLLSHLQAINDRTINDKV
jgi:uncharacterized protein (TIGR03546 family)